MSGNSDEVKRQLEELKKLEKQINFESNNKKIDEELAAVRADWARQLAERKITKNEKGESVTHWALYISACEQVLRQEAATYRDFSSNMMGIVQRQEHLVKALKLEIKGFTRWAQEGAWDIATKRYRKRQKNTNPGELPVLNYAVSVNEQGKLQIKLNDYNQPIKPELRTPYDHLARHVVDCFKTELVKPWLEERGYKIERDNEVTDQDGNILNQDQFRALVDDKDFGLEKYLSQSGLSFDKIPEEEPATTYSPRMGGG